MTGLASGPAQQVQLFSAQQAQQAQQARHVQQPERAQQAQQAQHVQQLVPAQQVAPTEQVPPAEQPGGQEVNSYALALFKRTGKPAYLYSILAPFVPLLFLCDCFICYIDESVEHRLWSAFICVKNCTADLKLYNRCNSKGYINLLVKGCIAWANCNAVLTLIDHLAS